MLTLKLDIFCTLQRNQQLKYLIDKAAIGCCTSNANVRPHLPKLRNGSMYAHGDVLVQTHCEV